MKHFPHSTLTKLQATQTGGQTNPTLRISIVPSFGGLTRASGLTTFVKYCYDRKALLPSFNQQEHQSSGGKDVHVLCEAEANGTPPLKVLSVFQQHFTFAQVLWLGNSYTFYNDLPIMVTRLAAAQGKSMVYSNHTESSWSWKSHAESALTMELIRSQPWDVVVLQEQSRKPAYPAQTICDDSIRHLSSLVVAIKANNPETVLQVSKTPP